MDSVELYEAVFEDLRDRDTWEAKQADLYKARYRGLRRTNPPWPGASDINWPLVDTIIGKLAPHYVGQLYATELLASFVAEPGTAGTPALATSAAQWFDYQLKHRTNFEHEILFVVNWQLMLGRPVLKVVWDAQQNRLRFVAIEPTRIIVPPSTANLWEADRITHVLSFSPDAYRRVNGWRNDADFVASITGKGSTGGDDRPDQRVNNAREQREGITCGDTDEIVIWETWVQTADGWECHTYAPVRPEDPVRPVYRNPYSHGLPPFADFPNEMTEPRWEAPRGVAEVVLPYQAQLTKLLNEKNDALTLYNRPLFQADVDAAPNVGNFRWKPGQIMPRGVKAMQQPQPPISWDVTMQMFRGIAEELAATPDQGMARQYDMRKARTATEMEQIATLNQQSSDLRMRIFRMSLARAYQLAWETLVQYDGTNLAIVLGDEATTIPGEALQGKYHISPSGSADGVTRQSLWGKAVRRLQMFNNDPFIDQYELRKSVLEADDSGLVKRVLRDPGLRQVAQVEEQGVEIGVMMLGLPAAVTSADDHENHIRTLLLFIRTQASRGTPMSPETLVLMQQHLATHMELLAKANPQAAKAAQDAASMIFQSLQPQQQPNDSPAQTMASSMVQ